MILPKKYLKRSPLKRRPKTPFKRLKKKLEALLIAAVKRRDNNTCQMCGKVVEGSNCHASHVIPRSRSLRLSFDIVNLKVLCYHCHLNVWHKNPVYAGEWFKKTFPTRWTYLEERMKEPIRPVKDYELEGWIKGFEYKELTEKGMV